jgi:hypothetical protein
MEAILDFGRGCQDLAIILLGECGGGGNRAQASCPVIAFEGGSEKRGGEGGERESKHVLALNAAICT